MSPHHTFGRRWNFTSSPAFWLRPLCQPDVWSLTSASRYELGWEPFSHPAQGNKLRSCAPLKLRQSPLKEDAWKLLTGNLTAKPKTPQFTSAVGVYLWPDIIWRSVTSIANIHSWIVQKSFNLKGVREVFSFMVFWRADAMKAASPSKEHQRKKKAWHERAGAQAEVWKPKLGCAELKLWVFIVQGEKKTTQDPVLKFIENREIRLTNRALPHFLPFTPILLFLSSVAYSPESILLCTIFHSLSRGKHLLSSSWSESINAETPLILPVFASVCACVCVHLCVEERHSGGCIRQMRISFWLSQYFKLHPHPTDNRSLLLLVSLGYCCALKLWCAIIRVSISICVSVGVSIVVVHITYLIMLV